MIIPQKTFESSSPQYELLPPIHNGGHRLGCTQFPLQRACVPLRMLRGDGILHTAQHQHHGAIPGAVRASSAPVTARRRLRGRPLLLQNEGGEGSQKIKQ